MPQYGRPSSDISNSGWTLSTGTLLWECINEDPYSDSDYIRATGATNRTCEVKFSSLTDPTSNIGHIVRFRAKATGSSSPEKMTVTLYQGATLIATVLSASTITRSTFNEYNYTLSAAEADAITNYADLRIRFATTSFAAGETIDVSWAVIEVPNVPTNTKSSSPSYVKGNDTGKISIPSYINAALGEKSNQPVYLCGNADDKTNTLGYLYGNENLVSNTPGFIVGSENTKTSIPVYMYGVELRTSITVYTHGSDSPKTNQAAYLVGSSTEKTFALSYVIGSEDIRDSRVSYLCGQDLTLNNISAVLFGQVIEKSNCVAFLEGTLASYETIHPNTDIIVNNWVNENLENPLYPSLADSDENTYVKETTTPSVGDYFEVGLEIPTGLHISGVYTLTWFPEHSEGRDIVLKCELRQGNTVIASDTQTVSYEGTVCNKILTADEVANITDYTNLRIRITVMELP